MTEQEYRELENYPYEPIFCSNEKECYDPKYLEMLKYATGDVELTNLEVRTLKWLSESDLYTVSNISRIIRKSREAERSKTSGLTKKDLLTVWGLLQSLKDIYENKAREAASRPDALGERLAGDYLKIAAEITPLQAKINKETEQCE